jgi:hypothetical protein
VIPAADIFGTAFLTKEATSQNYNPEWLITGYGTQDFTLWARALYDPAQWSHAFGFGQMGPGLQSGGDFQQRFYEWYWGKNRGTYHPANMAPIGLLFSGIHLAGPNLTPETFKAGKFADQPAGGAACGCATTYLGAYGRWGPHPYDDYNGLDDFAELWWSSTERGISNSLGIDGIGNYLYLDGGKRFQPGKIPTGEPRAFDRNGAVQSYPDMPAHDRPPDYPCTGCPSTTK